MSHPGETLRVACLAYPDVREDHPWGEMAFKVREKVFVFMHLGDETLGLSVKLPTSRDQALRIRGASPTGYGLGKHGWVSFRFDAGDDVPLDALRTYIDESFRAVAPKAVVARLAPAQPAPGADPPTTASPSKAVTAPSRKPHRAPAKSASRRSDRAPPKPPPKRRARAR